MIKCQVIENFNLEEFYKLSNIVRAGGRNDKGKLYVGDTFECDEDMVKYLSGGNKDKKVVIKVIEVLPKNAFIEMEVSFDSKKAINKVKEIEQNGGDYEEAVKEVEKIIDETIKVKPKKNKKSKKIVSN